VLAADRQDGWDYEPEKIPQLVASNASTALRPGRFCAVRRDNEPFAVRDRTADWRAAGKLRETWAAYVLSHPKLEMSHSNTISRPLVRLPEWMEDVLSVATGHGEQRSEQNRSISEVIEREQGPLFQFIRKRVVDLDDAEDILQDVFYELIEAYRLMQPIEQIGAWLYRVARNRIIDRFRRQRLDTRREAAVGSRDEVGLEDLLPSPDGGPEAAYARTVLTEELEAALDDLPEEQRRVFIAHVLEGRSFKQIADETGLKINTLLSRKHYAIVHLRRRLQAIYDEFMST